jgi:hypothetical protein
MPHTVYALLVGIDAYPLPVHPLRGCVNDVNAIASYLRSRSKAQAFDLRVVTLLNQEATRQAVIDGFRTHLCLAGSEDTALLYFSGHGSQHRTPPELRHLEPDGFNETLVCWDSRTSDGWDLADKELALLIAEVADRGAHVLVVLDCCHSGTGTRGDKALVNVRQIPPDERERPLSTFLFSGTAFIGQARTVMPTGWADIPQGRHVLLAACADRQLAHEYTVDGTFHGGFSYFLLKALYEAGGGATYRDLFKRMATQLLHTGQPQTPQMEATEPDDLGLPFLGATVRPRVPTFTVSYRDDIGWVVDGGALHGLLILDRSTRLILALYPFDATFDPFAGEDLPIRRVAVTGIYPHFSRIDPQTMIGVDPSETFQALVIEQPLPPLSVYFEGNESELNRIRSLLYAVGLPQIGVVEANAAEVCLIAQNEAYVITRPGAPQPLDRLYPYSQAGAAAVLRRLWHIARWNKFARLENPVPGYLNTDDIAVDIFQAHDPLRHGGVPGSTATQLLWSNRAENQDNRVRLAYTYANATWHRPAFAVSLTNTAHQSLYCALLSLSEDFSIMNVLPGACIRLDPGAMTRVRLGGEVPDALRAVGITETVSLLKLIVCTAAFDATLFEQTDKADDLPGYSHTSPPTDRTHNRPGTRKITLLDDLEEDVEDWIVSTIVITIVRPTEPEPCMDKPLLSREYSS